MKEPHWPMAVIIGMYLLFVIVLVSLVPGDDKDKVICPLCQEEARLINLEETDETIKHKYAGPCGSLITVEKSNDS